MSSKYCVSKQKAGDASNQIAAASEAPFHYYGDIIEGNHPFDETILHENKAEESEDESLCGYKRPATQPSDALRQEMLKEEQKEEVDPAMFATMIQKDQKELDKNIDSMINQLERDRLEYTLKRIKTGLNQIKHR